jgi:hypothetical protein
MKGLRALALLLLAGCGAPQPGTGTAPRPAGDGRLPPAPVEVRFTEVSARARAPFRHENGAAGKKYMPESVGSGLAFFDYDGDGWQDVLLMNGTHWPEDPGPARTPRLYRNRGDGTFADATRDAGIGIEMYGMGVAVGDYDNDGAPDLYLTGIGPNHLFRNTLKDPGRAAGPIFRDVTATARLQGFPIPDRGMGLRWKWSSSAAWLDYDRDGKLDLFVANYVKWSPQTDVRCGQPGGPKAYCPPGSYVGFPCSLYHNEGEGRFRDVSVETGIRAPRLAGKSFGIAVCDYNGDSWPDLAVSNDTWPNFLFMNEAGKRFVERGVEAGIANGEDGKTKAGMGIDVADWKNDGKFGLLIGNFSGESLSLWENDGAGYFTDQAHTSGMGSSSLLYLTFGLFFFDYDLDGLLDALTANGHIDNFVRTYDNQVSYEERPLLFHNTGGGKFTEVGEKAGLHQPLVARGAAYADIDNDGDLDVGVISNGQPWRLYRNDGGSGNHWIRFRTVGTTSNRDGIGALVRVTAAGVTQSRYIRSGSSFLSESQREPTFGLGALEGIDALEVRWPSGKVDRAGRLPAGRLYVIEEGQGVREEPLPAANKGG